MTKPSDVAMFALIGLGTLVLGGIAYALIASKGKNVFPIQVSVHSEPVTDPEGRAWVSALQHRLSPAQFEEVVKTNPVGRDYALGLFAHNDMTNHVRIL